jgi:RNA polymerase sigma-70 factor (ECF subfamily)
VEEVSGGEEVLAGPAPVGWMGRTNRSERSVIRAAQRGSPDAVEALVRHYWPEAVRVAVGVLADEPAAEDVAQEALLAAVRSLDRFNRRRQFRPWLHRIVVNRALDYRRARARRSEVEHSSEAPSGAHPDLRPGISPELISALKKLDLEERAIVVLRHVAGLTSTEIAGILEQPSATVRSTLRRSLGRLRVELGGDQTTEGIDSHER